MLATGCWRFSSHLSHEFPSQIESEREKLIFQWEKISFPFSSHSVIIFEAFRQFSSVLVDLLNSNDQIRNWISRNKKNYLLKEIFLCIRALKSDLCGLIKKKHFYWMIKAIRRADRVRKTNFYGCEEQKKLLCDRKKLFQRRKKLVLSGEAEFSENVYEKVKKIVTICGCGILMGFSNSFSYSLRVNALITSWKGFHIYHAEN